MSPAPESSDSQDPSERFRQRLESLHKECFQPLVSYLTLRTGSRHSAQDIAQQAFENMWALKDPSALTDLLGYLYRTAQNLLNSQYTHLAMRRRTEPVALYEPSVTSATPEEHWIEREDKHLLKCLIEKLGARRRLIIELRFWQGYSNREIIAHLASQGIEITERTLQRDIAEGLGQCWREILAMNGSQQEQRK